MAHRRRIGHIRLGQHFFDTGQLARRRTRKEMAQGQHGVRLAAAEVGLQLHDRVPAQARQPSQTGSEQPLQALREESTAEKLLRIAVFVRAFAQMHLPQIRGELRLLVAAARHVPVRGRDIAPSLQRGTAARLHRRAGRAPFFAAHLLIQHQPSQLALDLGDFVRLRRRYRGEEAFRRIQRPVRIVAGETLLMRPLIAPIPQFRNEAALGEAQSVAEHVVPRFPHELEEGGGIPVLKGLVGQLRIFGEAANGVHAHGVRLHLHSDFALHEGSKPFAEQLHRFVDALVVGGGHYCSSRQRPILSSSPRTKSATS